MFVAAAFGLVGCAGGSPPGDSAPPADGVSADVYDATVMGDGTEVAFGVGICERPLLDFVVEETSDEVRVRAITTDDVDMASCALQETVTLREPLGDRMLIDAGSGERITQVYDIADSAHTAADLASPRPVADDPDPAVRAGAADGFVDCDGPVHLGGWSLDFGGPGPASDSHRALEKFLAQDLFGLPNSGYDRAATDEGRALFTYEVEGAARVAVIVADAAIVDAELDVSDGWVVETFATCDPAEYAPTEDDELRQTVWTDTDGERVPTSAVTSYQGPEHCDWQSVTFLHLDERQYLRDPEHRLTSETAVPYDGDVDLPGDAVDTGYRRGDDELWLSDDQTIAYLVTSNTVEAWPSTTHVVGCA